MNTAFLLMAQYNGLAVIPLERVCRDYFSPLTPESLKRKLASGEIDLPMVQMTRSQKGARGVALVDLANYLDRQCELARTENDKLQNRSPHRACKTVG
ncbi:pyocin activator PrtN family protein [Pseudomonas sp. RIT-PI-S]|uniref:pyocin activator PrtN family protein n=1 Tax=Pseudomonas sp. RIT-PI-S TaxID=3035295 RepID=UPI0021DA376A|nr:pyocin activator PrtN family protein [Pseudomonas sp. RIT-PI-S]